MDSGAPFGRVTAPNACVAHRDAYVAVTVVPTDPTKPGKPCWLTVVATGERVGVAVFPDGSRQLAGSPDLPRVR